MTGRLDEKVKVVFSERKSFKVATSSLGSYLPFSTMSLTTARLIIICQSASLISLFTSIKIELKFFCCDRTLMLVSINIQTKRHRLFKYAKLGYKMQRRNATCKWTQRTESRKVRQNSETSKRKFTPVFIRLLIRHGCNCHIHIDPYFRTYHGREKSWTFRFFALQFWHITSEMLKDNLWYSLQTYSRRGGTFKFTHLHVSRILEPNSKESRVWTKSSCPDSLHSSPPSLVTAKYTSSAGQWWLVHVWNIIAVEYVWPFHWLNLCEQNMANICSCSWNFVLHDDWRTEISHTTLIFHGSVRSLV